MKRPRKLTVAVRGTEVGGIEMEEKILKEEKITFYTVHDDRGFYVHCYDIAEDFIQLRSSEDCAREIDNISDAKRLAKKIGGIITKHERIYTTKEFTEIVEVD